MNEDDERVDMVELKFKKSEPVTLIARTIESGSNFRTIKFLIDVHEFLLQRHPDDYSAYNLALNQVEALAIKTVMPGKVQYRTEWLNDRTLYIEWK